MKLCVEQCKMPKKNFITLFTGNETSETLQLANHDEMPVLRTDAHAALSLTI
jgi:hypothetical protein